MLNKLSIKNYAIIQQVEIEFHAGLNIITGETGAGKSIIMGALGLVLGERADAKAILNEDEKCVIEAHFDCKNKEIKQYFTQNDLDFEPTCILRREITANGKSRAFINDTPVNLNQLKELGSLLIDIVSQNETLALNSTVFQMEIIDTIANNEKALEEFRLVFNTYKKTEKLLQELIEKEAKSKQDEDYFKFILNELLEANIQPNEQTDIEQNINILSNAEEIKTITYQAYAAFEMAEPSLIDQLRNLKNSLQTISKHDKTILEMSNRLEQSIIELTDIAAELETIAEKTQANPEELTLLESRLQLLLNLQKKHRVNDNIELLAFQNKIDNDLLAISSIQNQIENTQKQLLKQKDELLVKANQISQNRAKSIPFIENKIQDLLQQVAMPNASLKINHEALNPEQINSNGIDKLEFLFAANKGSAYQNIQKVASGGELSRLMLCIKSLVSEKENLPSIVFDEIDTGISGEAALKVSQVLKNHAKKHQVLAITHLPQIAAKANAHFNVYKFTENNKTYSNIKLLNPTEQVHEIATMLSGNNPTEQVLLAAKELIHN